MTARVRSLLSLAVPLLALGGLALVLLSGPKRPPMEGMISPAPAVVSEPWVAMDPSAAMSPETIPGWDPRRGSWRLGTTVDGRKTLELLPEPIVEGKILCARAMRGGAAVRARMRGDRSRRAYPRFSLGLHQERELHLRAFPEARRLDLISCNGNLANVTDLASAPLPGLVWKPEDWIWLEFRIVPAGAGGRWKCEGRLWVDGTPRPDTAQLTHELDLPTGVFYAALQGAAFALRPLLIDAAEILPPAP